jgi:hypothetical protein
VSSEWCMGIQNHWFSFVKKRFLLSSCERSRNVVKMGKEQSLDLWMWEIGVNSYLPSPFENIDFHFFACAAAHSESYENLFAM